MQVAAQSLDKLQDGARLGLSDEKELCSVRYRQGGIACPKSDRKVLRYVSGDTTVIGGLPTRILSSHSCDLGYNGAITKVELRPLDGRE